MVLFFIRGSIYSEREVNRNRKTFPTQLNTIPSASRVHTFLNRVTLNVNNIMCKSTDMWNKTIIPMVRVC